MDAKGNAGVTQVISASMMRTQLEKILQSVKTKQDRFLISEQGEAQAVVFSVEDYLRSIVKRPEAIVELQQAAKQSGASKLTMEDIDAEIAASRKGL